MLIRGQEIMLPTSMVGNYPNPRWWDAYSTRYWTGDQRPPDSLGREALATATAQQHSSSASRRLHMKLLWIPHQPWPALDGQRERCLLDSWPDSGDELHILTWQPARGFDYLDLITYPDVEAAYIANSDLVLCTSRVLVDRVQTSGKQGVYVPNGVSMSRIALGQRDRTRAELGLQGKRVVSLIGLTSSPSLFFVDALALAARQVPNIVFLVVGGGDLLRPIVARCQRLGLPFVATGRVPSNEVANYFAAT